MDVSAYLPSNQWESMLERVSLNRGTRMQTNAILDSYDIICHLETTAKGAVDFYTLENNVARYESVSEAVACDDRLLKAWSAHPNHLVITNGVGGFKAKVSSAIEAILENLNRNNILASK